MVDQELVDYFRFQCEKGFVKRNFDKLPSDQLKIYRDRLEYEISSVIDMGFVGYFLIVQDILSWARKNNILCGPGRGSVAGSIVAYCLEITQVEPIRYGLIFERFINPGRKGTFPDIDMDFDQEQRDKILEYVITKYGRDHVSRISTFGLMRAKNAVRNVARALGHPYEIGDEIAKLLLPPVHGKPQSLKTSVENVPDLSGHYSKQGAYGEILHVAENFEGLVNSVGVHACLAGDSQILTQYGFLPLNQIFLNQTIEEDLRVLTPSGERKAIIVWQGKRRVYNIFAGKCSKSSNRLNLKLTSDHLLLTKEKGWVEAINSLNSTLESSSPSFDELSLSVLAGWFWNDGYFCKNGQNIHKIYFTPKLDDEALCFFRQYFTILKDNSRKDKFNLKGEYVNQIERLHGDGFKFNTPNKLPPRFQNPFQLLAWLKGFLSANATIQRNGIRVKLTSAPLVNWLKQCLDSLGFKTTNLCKNRGKIIKFKNGKYQCKDSFQIEVGRNYTWQIKNIIGFLQTYKSNKIRDIKIVKISLGAEEDIYDIQVEAFPTDHKNIAHSFYANKIVVHNCGTIVIPDSIQENVPLFVARGGEISSQWEMNNLEKLGYIKFDFLGLDTLTKISKCLSLIKLRHNISLDINSIDLEDDKVYEQLRAGNTQGVFQIEQSGGMRDLVVQIRPTKLEDIAALVAIYRPGPLASEGMKQYLEVRAGKVEPEYLMPELESILSNTNGFLIYQEQALRIAKELAGYTLVEADNLRKAIGKKITKQMAEHEEKFKNGCAANHLPSEQVNKLWQQIQAFADYSFNFSHALSYAMIAYYTAWFKTYYPTEWMCSIMTCDQNNKDQLIKYIAECNRLGINVSPPDINKSDISFSIAGSDSILFGLASIKNVGEGPVKAILEERAKHPFKGLRDFCERLDNSIVNKLKVESFIKSGAFDGFGYSRLALLSYLENYWQYRNMYKAYESKKETYLKRMAAFSARQKEIETGNDKLKPLKSYDPPEEPAPPIIDNANTIDMTIDEILKAEKELIGFYISDHPLDYYHISPSDSHTIDIVKQLSDKGEIRLAAVVATKQEITTKKQRKKMAFLTLEDKTGQIEAVLFPAAFERLKKFIEPGTAVFINGYLEVTEGEDETVCKLRIKNMTELENQCRKRHKIPAVTRPKPTQIKPDKIDLLRFRSHGTLRIEPYVLLSCGQKASFNASLSVDKGFLEQLKE